jgi:hypothetical protein
MQAPMTRPVWAGLRPAGALATVEARQLQSQLQLAAELSC